MAGSRERRTRKAESDTILGGMHEAGPNEVYSVFDHEISEKPRPAGGSQPSPKSNTKPDGQGFIRGRGGKIYMADWKKKRSLLGGESHEPTTVYLEDGTKVPFDEASDLFYNGNYEWVEAAEGQKYMEDQRWKEKKAAAKKEETQGQLQRGEILQPEEEIRRQRSNQGRMRASLLTG